MLYCTNFRTHQQCQGEYVGPQRLLVCLVFFLICMFGKKSMKTSKIHFQQDSLSVLFDQPLFIACLLFGRLCCSFTSHSSFNVMLTRIPRHMLCPHPPACRRERGYSLLVTGLPAIKAWPPTVICFISNCRS